MSRRRYLLLLTSVATSLAGCQSIRRSDDETPVGPELLAIGVGNWHSKPHTVRVRVRRNGDPVFQREVTLDSYSEQSDADETTFRDALPDEPGRYEITARRDGRPERTAEITDEDVCRVDVVVQKGGELGISSRRDCEYD